MCLPCMIERNELPITLEIWYFLLYNFFMLNLSFYKSFFWPDFKEASPMVTHSSGELPDQGDVSEQLLVAECGTRGDCIPINYYANVAGHFGVKTNVHVFENVNTTMLDEFSRGHFKSMIPSFINLLNASELGYKRAFVPHIEIDRYKGLSYSLSPSLKWIEKVKFVKEWKNVHWQDWVPAFLSSKITSVIDHAVHIGSLRDSDLPRSHDGLNLLKKFKNKGTHPTGWCCGSADESKIPLEIRENFPRIPNGDHNRIFQHYKEIHMHGGAGTVQTAIACGASPVIHDVALDRVYHKLPTQKDFRQASISVFMGWLTISGFKVNAPFEIKVIWSLLFVWNQKWRLLATYTYDLVKLYVIISFIYNHWLTLAILAFSIPIMFWKMMMSESIFTDIANWVIGFMWEFPLFCLIDSKIALFMAMFSIMKLGNKALQDYSNLVKTKTEIIFEPVKRSGLEFPFPFGHWSLRDKNTQMFYEGNFTNVQEQSFGHSFKFIERKRELKEGAKIFPAPFDISTARRQLKDDPQPYGPFFNCAILTVRPIIKRSLFWGIFILSINAAISFVLQPPEYLSTIIKILFPGYDIEKTALYQKFGFAAGVEQIPLVHLDEQEEAPIQEIEDKLLILQKEESLEGLYATISIMQNQMHLLDLPTLDQEDLEEASQRTFAHEMENIQTEIDDMITITGVPPYVKHTWAQIVDMIHGGISFIRQSTLISNFVAWLKSIEQNVYTFMAPVMEVLIMFYRLAVSMSQSLSERLFQAVCHFLDHVYGLEASKRVKTVWGLTGIYKTGAVGAAMRLAMSIQMSEYQGRTDFLSDYTEFCNKAKEYADRTHTGFKNRIGGPQRRPIHYSKPLMSVEEAKLLGFTEGEYETSTEYQSRVDEYLSLGIKQGADGVFLADKNPELIAKSQHRYEPRYAELTQEERYMAVEIANALYEQYPETFKDADIVPMGSVLNYIKKKYSPGTPFIGEKGFKTRQAMFDTGYDKVMIKKAQEYLASGTYPVQIYHAFVKSQVVDIQKCLPPHLGGKGKDVRTVVSQDLFSYFMDQCLQIERNKRRTWDSYGAGIGMPLNQSMEAIYAEMADKQKERGGRYIIADGTAFDSFCKPFLFQVSAELWRLGFKDHESGNGEAMASVLKASYDSRQNCWIIGITEPEYDKLVLSITDHDLRKTIESKSLANIVPLADFIDFEIFNKLKHNQQVDYVNNLDLPPGKVYISWRQELRPKSSNWIGDFSIVSEDVFNSMEHNFQTFRYPQGDEGKIIEDIKRIGTSDFRFLSNVHAKNRGGSTGGSDTSNVNTVAFKAGLIRAWCLTTGRTPKEFFEYNILKNTSDDTIWQSGGTFGLNTIEQLEIFKHHASEVGIHLTIETTKNINEVEYLSKFVRTPTASDSQSLKQWRKAKIQAIQNTHRMLGRPVPENFEQLNNPRFIVVQNPKAILLRRSAFRYYQAHAKTWRYHAIERGAGHALNTPFVPELYSMFAKEWCDDVNSLLEEHKIHRKFRLQTNGQFSLPCVEQFDPRAPQQALSPRQKAFLSWLKGNMFPSYYRVIDVHMNIAKPDPLYSERLMKKLSRGWRGYDQILAEGVDQLFRLTEAIPDSWSKKFNGSIDMLYPEIPFYTKNQYIEKFVYMKMLEESKEEEITASEFVSRLQEGPYAGTCDPFYFMDQMKDANYRENLFNDDVLKYQGMAMFISLIYMAASFGEWFLLGVPFIGSLYKMFIWSFVGLNKVYGVTNTMYWHSTGKSSREISRIQPKDPYIVSKQFAAFIIDLFPAETGYLLTFPVLILNLLPFALEAFSKFWYEGNEIKNVANHRPNAPGENPWSSYASECIQKTRNSVTRKLYLAAKTGTGKSSWNVAALWGAKHQDNIRKIWVVQPRKILRDETTVPFGIKTQVLKAGIIMDNSIDIYFLTYGHLQSRLYDIDNVNDIVLFDEFHETQGTMILGLHTVKAPIILLSATPVEIPSLTGTPMMQPDIKRRYPITVHECDDSLSVGQMFLLAYNKYPELIKRSLVIVPTLKQVAKVKAELEWYKVGPVYSLTSREREVPKEGIIVATPYVQTGLDINPPPDLLIDCGKDIVIDEGVFIYNNTTKSLPWTDKDVNTQREGRVGRNKPGVVFRPKSAGSGKKATFYPEPNIMVHQVVADFYRIPALTFIQKPTIQEMPYFMVSQNHRLRTAAVKSLTFLHALAMQGVKEDDYKAFYARACVRQHFGEDHEFLNKVLRNRKWDNVPLIPWEELLYHWNRRDITFYSINGSTISSGPLKMIRGKWEEITATSLSSNTCDEEHTNESMIMHYQKRLDVVKSCAATALQNIRPDLALKIIDI